MAKAGDVASFEAKDAGCLHLFIINYMKVVKNYMLIHFDPYRYLIITKLVLINP